MKLCQTSIIEKLFQVILDGSKLTIKTYDHRSQTVYFLDYFTMLRLWHVLLLFSKWNEVSEVQNKTSNHISRWSWHHLLYRPHTPTHTHSLERDLWSVNLKTKMHHCVLCLSPDLQTFLWWVIGFFLSITVPDSFC